MANKHCLFVGHLLYGRNNIYEEQLVQHLRKKFDTLQVVSVNKTSTIPDMAANKQIKRLKAFRRPFVDEVVRFCDFLFYCSRWCRKTKDDKRVIILLSAPVEINYASLWLKRLVDVKVVNLIIDTAMGNILSRSFWDKYNCTCFQKAEKLCRKMTASMALNQRVFPYLQLENKPCHVTKIGHSLETSNWEYTPARENKKIIVYTGTLIYYDGTKQLLDAMTLLDPQCYELHIYGRGPDETLVRQYQSTHPNIKLMGYLPNKEMKAVMASADLLVNPRIDNKMTDTFGFPSKMIEYLLSGTPVLTTRFAAMPDDYLSFVHLIKNQTGQGISNAIENVFSQPEEIRKQMSREAYDYAFVHHSYNCITDDMINFIDTLK